MTTVCPYLEKCPIFERFTNKGLGNIWVTLYCKGSKQADCARKRLKESGQQVPITLLPNGKHLDSLDE